MKLLGGITVVVPEYLAEQSGVSADVVQVPSWMFSDPDSVVPGSPAS